MEPITDLLCTLGLIPFQIIWMIIIIILGIIVGTVSFFGVGGLIAYPGMIITFILHVFYAGLASPLLIPAPSLYTCGNLFFSWLFDGFTPGLIPIRWAVFVGAVRGIIKGAMEFILLTIMIPNPTSIKFLSTLSQTILSLITL